MATHDTTASLLSKASTNAGRARISSRRLSLLRPARNSFNPRSAKNTDASAWNSTEFDTSCRWARRDTKSPLASQAQGAGILSRQSHSNSIPFAAKTARLTAW
jgi:hypothetical protein